MAGKGRNKKIKKPVVKVKDVPNVRASSSKVIAVLTSDWHLSHTPPIFRSAEPDWYDAMKRPLQQVVALTWKYNCPLIIAGDIFDRHGAASKTNPAQLVNFAIELLSEVKHGTYTVAGQHDLPMHRSEDIGKSSYATLMQCGAIEDIGNGKPYPIETPYYNIIAYGFGWGQEVKPLPEELEGAIALAVIHSYIWTPKQSYPGAPEESRLRNWIPKIAGYDAAIFGDNHRGFKAYSNILNCGTLMRRKLDEMTYQPQVGLLHDDGTIEVHKLDCSEDKFIDPKDESQYRALVTSDADMEEFMSELAALGGAALDFHDSVKRFLRDNKNKISPHAKRVILQAMEEDGAK